MFFWQYFCLIVLKIIMAAKKNKQTAQEEVKQEAQEPVVENNDLLLETQEALEAEKKQVFALVC